ncbi:MAG: single-stranded DNA-binding protein [Gordonia sp. (in: high G+C Gram-positive bacteria)]|uniref:single-stranded DNA-binding protein n=1 Tax=Gordonia sp. (in: high G+C Gram-positive bacteria) TaxID=84139 RepID=UPI0039E3C5D3
MHEVYTTITGRVVSDPRPALTNGHGEVLSFRVGCFARRRDQHSGEWVDGQVLYLDVTCWRRVAESAAGVIRRGSMIIAHGQLHTSEYTGNDGVGRQKLELTATAIGLDLARRQPAAPGSPGDPSTAEEAVPLAEEPACGEPPPDAASHRAENAFA